MPEAREMVDDGARVALLGAQGAQVRGLVVRQVRRMLYQILHAYQRSPMITSKQNKLMIY